VSSKKGKRVGVIVADHKISPFFAPWTDVCGKNNKERTLKISKNWIKLVFMKNLPLSFYSV
jgi:hypothetical protein